MLRPQRLRKAPSPTRSASEYTIQTSLATRVCELKGTGVDGVREAGASPIGVNLSQSGEIQRDRRVLLIKYIHA